jgi:GNAT superfamily N-acetyltransferase
VTAPIATLERIEADAMTAFYLGAPRADRIARGVVVEAIAGAVLTGFPGLVPPRLFNRVLLLGLERAPDDADIDRIISRMTAIGQPWQIAPPPDPDLLDRLRARGFTEGYAWDKFHRPADPPAVAPTDLAVRRLVPADAAQLTAVLAEALHLVDWLTPWVAASLADPRFDWFGAFAGPELAATGALFTAGAAAWFGFAATLERHRRRGAQAAILAARIARAIERGARDLVVETGVPTADGPGPSWKNLHRAGFHIAYTRLNLVPPS